MALLFMDGFDHYATADVLKKWTSGSLSSINTTLGRRGGGCAVFAGTMITKSVPNSTTLTAGFAIQRLDNANLAILKFTDNSTDQMVLQVDSNFKLNLYRNTTLVAGPSSQAVTTNAYMYIEMKVTFSATVGAYEVRMNGVTIFSATGVNTIGSANAYANNVSIGSYNWNARIDDFYLCDGTGSANNTFLGDSRIDALYPTSDGANLTWTPSTGTTHYTCVNKTAPATTPNVSDGTSGDLDTYGHGAISHNPVAIFGTQTCMCAQKSDAGAMSIKEAMRSGGTNYTGASQALATSLLIYREVRETDPATSAAWTQSGVNAAEIGTGVV